MYKVQLTLTPQEAIMLGTKADKLGYSVTKLIKLIIGKEALSVVEQYPTFNLGAKALEKIENAHNEHKEGETLRLKDVNDLDRL